jgi:hypothetical protein
VKPRTVRRLVLVVFVAGIGGMIVGSIADNNGIAITFGIITAMGALGLILVTSVAGPGAFNPARGAGPDPSAAEAIALDVESGIVELSAAGTDEGALRHLVQRAVELGRATPR